jgi:uncharacterized protein (TIGR03086 family)
MSTLQYEQAIDEFRQVLAAVAPDQYGDATPCESFNVAQLVDHTIGTQLMIVDALQDKPFNMTGIEVAPGEQSAAFDRAAADAVAELDRDGAMTKGVTLPFGSFTGEQLMGLGVLDTFQHAWDLAKATGQDTDLAPEMAEMLMSHAVAHMAHAPRGPEPAPYAAEQPVPDGASAADRLAAFLGRTV